MIIISLTNISIVTFRFSEVQKFKNHTSRIPISGNQEVKKIDFKSSGFQNADSPTYYFTVAMFLFAEDVE